MSGKENSEVEVEMIQTAQPSRTVRTERASELGDARELLNRLEKGPLPQDDLEKMFRLLQMASRDRISARQREREPGP